MKQALYLILYMVVATLVIGCTGKNPQTPEKSTLPQDTVYTQQAAMAVYGYQPERALQIIDSAVIVGNISEVRGDVNRARIYSQSQMMNQLDSLLGGPKGVRLDTARAIAERLLLHDSLKTYPKLHQDVLEILIYAARQQEDTVRWLQRSRELVGESRKHGAETKALRTEAELGASLCYSGQQEQGLAKLDSVITAIGSLEPFRFYELDAYIIAAKRKISVLASIGREEETLPLARRIIELLDDYEQHPDQYHDGSYREPKNDTKRADYIRFYRSQAQGFITAAYTALGDKGNMTEAYEKIERTVRDATAREHIARYNALQQQMEAERQRAETRKANLTAWAVGIIALLAIAFAVYAFYMNRKTKRKNRVLVREITDALEYKKRYEDISDAMRQKVENVPVKPAEKSTDDKPNLEALSDAELFQYLNHAIRHEELYLQPAFGRQMLADRFHLSDRRIGAAFAKGSGHRSLSEYIRNQRVEYSCRLLTEHPEMTIAEVGTASGFSSVSVFCRSFKEHIQMTPSEFQKLNVSD